jgi:hypothetical protein
MNSKLKLMAIVLLVLLLSGCKSVLLVKDVSQEQMATIVKDYAGIHGYQFTYQNDKTGSYRLSLGMMYMPNTSQTTQTSESSQRLTTGNVDQTATSYERTTWETVNDPGHFVEATAMLRLLQQGSNVSVVIESNNASGSALDDFSGYLKDLGYTVENK